MKTSIETKLDNPVWHALTESHRQLALESGGVKFYHPDYCPFGGLEAEADIASGLDGYSGLVASFYVVGSQPPPSAHTRIYKELVCLQMVCLSQSAIEPAAGLQALGPEHAGQLYELVNLVQPGYFKSRTAEMGHYYGIFHSAKLVAVTGERMKMEGLTEVSAVVTHPDHTGKGYAKQLVAHTVNRILERGEVPFLHVVYTNSAAVSLYEKLGFVTRRRISFWNLHRRD